MGGRARSNGRLTAAARTRPSNALQVKHSPKTTPTTSKATADPDLHHTRTHSPTLTLTLTLGCSSGLSTASIFVDGDANLDDIAETVCDNGVTLTLTLTLALALALILTLALALALALTRWRRPSASVLPSAVRCH